MVKLRLPIELSFNSKNTDLYLVNIMNCLYIPSNVRLFISI